MAPTRPSDAPQSCDPVAAPEAAYLGPGRNAALLRVLGAIFLLVAVGMSGMLVLSHLDALKLPGCGPGSACADLANGFFGSIRIGTVAGSSEPRFRWPVSYLGLAYFVALFVVWLASPRGVGTPLRWLIRVGILISVGFVMIMVREKHLCQYCIGTHAGNLAFWITAELLRSRRGWLWRPLVIFAAVFALSSVGLAVADTRVKQAVAVTEEQEFEDSLRVILESVDRDKAQNPPAGDVSKPAPPAQTAPASKPARPEDQGHARRHDSPESPFKLIAFTQSPPQASGQAPAAPKPATSQPAAGNAAKPKEAAKPPLPKEFEWDTVLQGEYPFKNGFRGLYLYGPEEAAVRIVMFTDYGCPDCKKVNEETKALLDKYPKDVSLSVKLFPFCTDCNPTVERNLHPNGCWAARAAEAAGLMWGNDGFWKMHWWLFERSGVFATTQILEDGVRSVGYDPKGFVTTALGDETLKRIQADIREARYCGLYQTPMVFINGNELRGWRTANALTRAVEAVLARKPAAHNHAQDHPPMAIDKFIGDWRDSPRYPTPPDNPRWMRGPEKAPIEVIVYGDYAVGECADADAFLQKWVAGRSDTSYTWRHFPFNQECNRCMHFTRYYASCWAARAAEAAGRLNGAEGFWKVHTWMMQHHADLDETALRAELVAEGLDADKLMDPQKWADNDAVFRAAAAKMTEKLLARVAADLGFDRDKLAQAIGTTEAEAAVKDDVEGADKVSLQSVPLIIINGRQVGRWTVIPGRGPEILEKIMLEAGGKK